MTETIIGAAIEVHRDKGPGLIESIYEWCLIKEFELRGLAVVNQKVVLVRYKGFTREEPLRFDLLVAGRVLVEAKAVQEILPIHKAQLLSYMKLPERANRPAHQFSRNEANGRCPPSDLARSE